MPAENSTESDIVLVNVIRRVDLCAVLGREAHVGRHVSFCIVHQRRQPGTRGMPQRSRSHRRVCFCICAARLESGS